MFSLPDSHHFLFLILMENIPPSTPSNQRRHRTVFSLDAQKWLKLCCSQKKGNFQLLTFELDGVKMGGIYLSRLVSNSTCVYKVASSSLCGCFVCKPNETETKVNLFKSSKLFLKLCLCFKVFKVLFDHVVYASFCTSSFKNWDEKQLHNPQWE